MGTLAIHFDENPTMVQAGNVNMFFAEGGDKYLLSQLTLLMVVIKVGCAGDPEKMGHLQKPVKKSLRCSKHGQQSDLYSEWR